MFKRTIGVVIVAAAVSACGGGELGSVAVGQEAPVFKLANLRGERVSLRDFRRGTTLVNFWASWCVPCREEFPLLATARATYAPQGLEILGVIHDDSAQNAAAFAATYHAEWPLLVDANDTAWTAYHGAFVPVSYFIDRDGIVRAVSYGPPPQDNIDAVIAKIL